MVRPPVKLSCNRFKTGYLDESGDNGKNGSKFLVLTYVCTNENKKIAKIIKDTCKQLKRTKKGKKWLQKTGGELKFYGFPDKGLLVKTLAKLSNLDLTIKFISIKKNGKDIKPEEKLEIVIDLLGFKIIENEDLPYKIVADKDYFYDKKIAYFIVNKYEETESVNGNGEKVKELALSFAFVDRYNLNKYNKENECLISINQENSRKNVNLQACDLVCGAIARSVEKGDGEYMEILGKKIKIMRKEKEKK